MAVEWRQALVNAVLIPIRFRQGTVSHSGSGNDTVSRPGRSRQGDVCMQEKVVLSPVLADLVTEMVCSEEVEVVLS